ncbi:MAG: inositol monophosphatase family protein [Planctomycetota bacterium]
MERSPPWSADELLATRDRAVALAQEAGEVLLRHRREGLVAESKGRRRELVTAADRDAERVVVGGIQRQWPSHAVLAEEGVLTAKGRSDREADWTWIVDPLDGTTNFVHGVPFFAVAIALAWRDRPVVGVVHAPALGDTYAAAAGLGAHWNGTRIQVSRTAELADALVATGFSYERDEPGRDDNLGRLQRVLPRCRDVRRLGSAELDLCLCARGTYDAYWELYLAPYDVAAGAVIVREAGGRVTDLRGGEDWLHGGRILASNGALHEEMLAVCGD